MVTKQSTAPAGATRTVADQLRAAVYRLAIGCDNDVYLAELAQLRAAVPPQDGAIATEVTIPLRWFVPFARRNGGPHPDGGMYVYTAGGAIRVTAEIPPLVAQTAESETSKRDDSDPAEDDFEAEAVIEHLRKVTARLEFERDIARLQLENCLAAAEGKEACDIDGDDDLSPGWSPAYQAVLDLRQAHQGLQQAIAAAVAAGDLPLLNERWVLKLLKSIDSAESAAKARELFLKMCTLAVGEGR